MDTGSYPQRPRRTDQRPPRPPDAVGSAIGRKTRCRELTQQAPFTRVRFLIRELQQHHLIFGFRRRDGEAVRRLVTTGRHLPAPSSVAQAASQERSLRSRGGAEIGEHPVAVDDVPRDVTLQVRRFRAVDLFLVSRDEVRQRLAWVDEAQQQIGVGCQLMVRNACDQASHFHAHAVGKHQVVLGPGCEAAPAPDRFPCARVARPVPSECRATSVTGRT
jgi:hypothetical protein